MLPSFVDLSYLMGASVSGEHSTNSDSVGPPTDNCYFTTATTIPLANVSLLLEGLPRDEFTFIGNHKPFPTSVVEAVLLSPAVGEQLQVDACTRRFVIRDAEIDSTDFFALQNVLSAVETAVQKPHQKSLIRLSQQLGNVVLE
jgi:hypothetical protein